MTATGGVVSEYTDGGIIYRVHVFTSSGPFGVTEIGDLVLMVDCDYLVVAGGGSGAGGCQQTWRQVVVLVDMLSSLYQALFHYLPQFHNITFTSSWCRLSYYNWWWWSISICRTRYSRLVELIQLLHIMEEAS